MSCQCQEDLNDLTEVSVLTIQCVQQQDRCFEPYYIVNSRQSSFVGAYTYNWRLAIDRTDIETSTCMTYADDGTNPAEIAGKQICITDPFLEDQSCVMTIGDQQCESCTFCPDAEGSGTSYASASCTSLATDGDDPLMFSFDQCPAVLAEGGNPDDAARDTIFEFYQDNMERCRTAEEVECDSGLDDFNDEHAADLQPLAVSMGSILSARNFSDFCTTDPWGQSCLVNWQEAMEDTTLMRDFENVCVAASGAFIHASFEIECEAYELPGVPTYYQASLGRPLCVHANGCQDVALGSIRESVRKYVDDNLITSDNANLIEVCSFTVDWTDPATANTNEDIFRVSDLVGPPQLDTQSKCLLIQDQLEDAAELSYIDIGDMHLPHSPGTLFSCSCLDAVPAVDANGEGLVETISATCGHRNPLCLRSNSNDVAGKLFAGTDMYESTVGLIDDPSRSRRYLDTLRGKHCFQYAGSYNNQNICFEGDYATNDDQSAPEASICKVTIGDQACQSCRFCNPNDLTEFSISVDCTNIMPDVAVIDECANVGGAPPMSVDGTFLQFLGSEIEQVDVDQCESLFNSGGGDGGNVDPTDPPPPTQCIEIQNTDQCSSLQYPADSISVSDAATSSCDCLSFCDGQYLGCVGFGESPDEQQQCSDGYVVGCKPGDLQNSPPTFPPTSAPTGSPVTAAPSSDGDDDDKKCFQNNLATDDTCRNLLAGPSVSTTKCSCYNFCDGVLMGCTGSAPSSQLNGGTCEGAMVVGCSFAMLEEETSSPTIAPNQADSGANPTGNGETDGGGGGDGSSGSGDDTPRSAGDSSSGTAVMQQANRNALINSIIVLFSTSMILLMM